MALGWRSTFRREQAAWGSYQGSSSSPYECVIDLSGPWFRCSCPSRKLPCKHAQQLLALVGAEPSRFPDAEPPPWVAEWIAQRRARGERAAPADPERAAADQRKRAERREQRISGGIDELERWLQDLARAGLAEVRSRPRQSFLSMAARLMDAQAPGLARLVRELGYLPHSGDRWPERMLIVMGRVQLLIDAWRMLDSFEPELQAELRAQVGINESRDAVFARAPVRDMWSVLGRRQILDERFQIQRTWLWGEQTRRWALVLDFAAGFEMLSMALSPGMRYEADLFFFAGAMQLRALVGDALKLVAPVQHAPAVSIGGALHDYAQALARNPWIERFPMVLADVTPRGTDYNWMVVDARGQSLPLAGSHGWRLLATSGGRPIQLVGEWDGYALQPLGTLSSATFAALPSLAA